MTDDAGELLGPTELGQIDSVCRRLRVDTGKFLATMGFPEMRSISRREMDRIFAKLNAIQQAICSVKLSDRQREYLASVAADSPRPPIA